MNGQCPNFPLELKTQAEVNAFATNYPGCSQLLQELRINGEESDIVDLSPLEVITHTQDLYVTNTDAPNLYGLHNIVSTDHLSIGYNGNFVDLSGLDALESCTEFNIWFNWIMTSLDGAPNLNSIQRINIFQNFQLSDISELSDITDLLSIGIAGNNITSLNGLQNLEAVAEDLFIANEELTNLNEISSISTIGSIFIINQPNLVDISVFGDIQSVHDIMILDCPQLSDLTGLQNLNVVTGILRLGFVPMVDNLNVFQNLTEVQELDFYENESLVNLNGLQNLTSIGKGIQFIENPNLNDISAIGDLSAKGMESVIVFGNDNLLTCDYPLICEAIFDPEIYDQVESNGGSCLTSQQVAALCLLGNESHDLNEAISIYPNPTSDHITVAFPSDLNLQSITVYNHLGQLLLQEKDTYLNLSSLSSGVYLLGLQFQEGLVFSRLVKE